MYPSNALCVAQAQLHGERADAAELENVRNISLKAAKAWAQEAIFAQQREDRQQKAKAIRDREAAGQKEEQPRKLVTLADGSLRGGTPQWGIMQAVVQIAHADFDAACTSENPDRGHAG